MRQFKGRVIVPGECAAPALVSHGGFNTLASYQTAMLFNNKNDKEVKCGDQNNPDLYKQPMFGKALCLPITIGSTTGGMVLYTAARLPAVFHAHRLPGRQRGHSRRRLDGRDHARCGQFG